MRYYLFFVAQTLIVFIAKLTQIIDSYLFTTKTQVDSYLFTKNKNIKIIGFAGVQGSGKSTLSEHLQNNVQDKR